MSTIAKGSLSLRKKDVLQQRHAGTAFRRLVFAHKASAGETGVNFTALNQPPEMAALGFLNPSSADILAANIFFYKKNLTVISSARGVLIQDLSYTVPTSSKIEFQGFTALDGEIFTFLLETGVKDGINVVDASPIIATGELAVGSTDFNVGVPFEVNKFSNQQVGAVLVFRDGIIQFRNPNNSTSGGNYQEIDNGSGLGTIIRFNSAPVGVPSNIVVWGHHLAERPDGSMMAAIESLAGQIDKMIPTLALLAGVPETTFQAAPNNQDLKAFGNKVYDLDSKVVSLDNHVTLLDNNVTSLTTRVTNLEDTNFITVVNTGGGTVANTWFDALSVTLTPGEWDIIVTLTGYNIASTIGSFNLGLSTVAGNAAPGPTEGIDFNKAHWNGNANLRINITFHRFGIIVPASSTQIWYAKALSDVNNSNFGCRLSARRIKKG